MAVLSADVGGFTVQPASFRQKLWSCATVYIAIEAPKNRFTSVQVSFILVAATRVLLKKEETSLPLTRQTIIR